VEPCWWHDVGAALLLEEERKPEGQLGTMWWSQGRSRALDGNGQLGAWDMMVRFWSVEAGRTLSSSIPSSRPLGTTVTISISQRNETSAGVRPGGCGWAILGYSRLLSCHGGSLRI
jgi:hypothetical protein